MPSQATLPSHRGRDLGESRGWHKDDSGGNGGHRVGYKVTQDHPGRGYVGGDMVFESVTPIASPLNPSSEDHTPYLAPQEHAAIIPEIRRGFPLDLPIRLGLAFVWCSQGAVRSA